MDEHKGDEHKSIAFVGSQRLTVSGRRLHSGERAPDFRLDYLDMADLTVRMVSLADSTGMVRLLNVVNSLQRPICQRVTRKWEAFCTDMPAHVCIYTVSIDSPQMQAGFQDSVGVLHQALSAQRGYHFGQDYGVWLAEWQLLQRSVFVIDQNERIFYNEYVADQHDEPNYAAALQAVERAAAS